MIIEVAHIVCMNTVHLIKKKITFGISEDEFNKLRNESPCYICGKCTTETHCNGIDRCNNNKGYTIDNCQSCCADCNFMKNNLDYDIFITRCLLISCNHDHRLDQLLDIWQPSVFHQKNINKIKLTDEQKSEIKNKRDKKKTYQNYGIENS